VLFSSSSIVIKINEKNINALKNVSFEEDGKFYSLCYKKEIGYNIGEIHWAESFKYGKINIVSFVQINKYFFLFTSSVQNFIPFKKILNHIYKSDSDIEIYKLPIPVPSKKINDDYIKHIDIDKYFGLTVNLDADGYQSITKIYTNGLITYSILYNVENEKAIEILKIILKILEVYNENNDI